MQKFTHRKRTSRPRGANKPPEEHRTYCGYKIDKITLILSVGMGDDARGAGTPRSGGAAERRGSFWGLFASNLPELSTERPPNAQTVPKGQSRAGIQSCSSGSEPFVPGGKSSAGRSWYDTARYMRRLARGLARCDGRTIQCTESTTPATSSTPSGGSAHSLKVRTSNVVGEDGESVSGSVGGGGEGASRVTWPSGLGRR